MNPAPGTDELADFALALIGSRFSVSPKRLHAPGPSAEQLRRIVEAAGTAPDHRELRPWRLLRIAAAQRDALADLFEAALLERDPAAGEAERAEARVKAHRAPELLLAVAKLQPPHDDVVEHERYVTLGAALMALLLTAHAMGFAGMLTSGRALRSGAFARGLGLADDERPVCFVSLGTASEVRRHPRTAADQWLADWAPRRAAP
ncbi:nitroreductase family protein [Azohydromonas sp.]|uniref:nitroreductase family protein n=1 Tax=Azohydromonas sp. TaxID=1872666 RepID=UPI002C65A61C|nr:nitroreductase family protein [Azohydromonas sp.]HMM85836.1 nitroreductase family protein [Azohydromonas sp.]